MATEDGRRIGTWAPAPPVDAWDGPFDEAATRRLGAGFRSAGFTTDALDELLGPLWSKPQQELGAQVNRLGDGPLAVLVAVFVAGAHRSVDSVVAAGLAPDDLVAAELAVVVEGMVVPAFRVEPWRGLVVASDPPVPGRVDAGFVLGPSVSGDRCADLTVRHPVERALDLGTGGGLQALLLARHAREVVATDVNPRALWLARRNAALNGVDTVEWRLGSWLEPVAGERFGVVAANAPFVITPDATALYLDGGVAGGGVSELLARTLPSLLADGGFATLTSSWIEAGDDPIASPRAWLAEAACAALVLTLRRLDADEHARTWAALPADADAAATAARRWAEGLRALGAGHVHEGALVLRRDRTRPCWVEHQAFAADAPNDAGGHVARMFAGIDLLHELGPVEPIDARLVVAPTVRLHEVVVIGDAAEIEQAELRMTDGIAPVGHVDPITVAALARLRRTPTARVAVREAALAAGVPADALGDLEAQATGVVRELVRLGVLERTVDGPMPPCPVSPDAEALRVAADALAAVGFDDARVRAELGLGQGGALDVRDHVAARLGVDLGTPLGAAVWLFVLELALDEAEAAATLGPAVEPLEQAGLLARADGTVRSTVRLVPYEHLLVASDRSDVDGDERVPGPLGSAHLLAALTPREPVGRALDLGTGTGVQALLLASHAQHVVGTDVVPRALDYARANAALNGIDNVTWRLGSWLEPVAGERFDLVVANPPLVISPERRYRFRDGDGGTDEVSRHVVALLPASLAEGGIAVASIGWVQPADDAVPAPQAWLAGSGCDGWLLVHELQTALRSAEVWNAPLRDDPGAYEERLDAWVRHFEDRGVAVVGYGAVALRRRAGASGTTRTARVDGTTLGRGGDQLARMLRAAGRLDGATASTLLDLTVVLSDEATVVQAWGAGGAGRTTRVRTEGALGLDLAVDERSGVLVSLLTEPVLVREAVVEAASRLGVTPDEVAAPALGLVDGLLRYGVLAVVDDGDEGRRR